MAHPKHGPHCRDFGSVETQRLVEDQCRLLSRRGVYEAGRGLGDKEVCKMLAKNWIRAGAERT